MTVKKSFLIILTVMLALSTHAQQRVVVADNVTHEPIAQASIYTKENGKFNSAISNDQGVAVVNFLSKDSLSPISTMNAKC